MKNKKKWVLLLSMLMLMFILTGCSTSEINQSSTGLWDRYIVYYFGQAIEGLSFGYPGLGIILFTIIIRIILLPLMNHQQKSMRKTQELQPQLKALQEKYASKDAETVRKLQEEQQRLYAEMGVNPLSGCLPLIIQIPILMALWQAISRIPALTSGTFLGLALGNPDPTFILPILAAVFTLISTKLSMMSQQNAVGAMKAMTYVMPAFILIMGINLASGLSLYWVVSNAFQVIQTLIINNPFKIQKERAAEEQRKRELEKALKKANSSKKRKK